MKLPSWLLNNRWMSDPNVLAQFGHGGIPYGILLTLDHFHHNVLVWAIGFSIIAYAAVKEFWFDATYEVPKQPFKNNITDFSFYCLGVGLALFVHTR